MTRTPPLPLQAQRFAALGDPTRLEVFRLISREPLAVAEVAARLPVSRPAVSQHLAVLMRAGLARCEVRGARHVYGPDADGVASMRDFIDSLWSVGLARFKAEAEAIARQRQPQPSQPPRKEKQP